MTVAETTTLPQNATISMDGKKPADNTSADDRTIIFVLGGPGAGKGTQCAKIVKDFDFVHLSAGDLLREEQARADKSEVGQIIADCIRQGVIVPMHITIGLLETSMNRARQENGSRRFLIDGFPRAIDQALEFEQTVGKPSMVLFLDCSEEEMERRLLERGLTSGRTDDNPDSIRKRFRTFVETSMPVIHHYEAEKIVSSVGCLRPINDVYQDIRTLITDLIISREGSNASSPFLQAAATQQETTPQASP
ncbi:hypothetical protein H696_00818 [Fonticula alba]|uniref:UMP-CMP kinase n=1 Tax=Fonticula alba TaxID=691883 RepID=A0A058ZH35_FONAL|nr:hypothetical protein H696_00818 [Fonticula alba]KCV73276.1 hypothetical protein H696_00818 [Fonticula alba]|eukprot:XP_009492977.1 hypothetical protein H696_00818 [Fonticula alba]